MNVKLRFEKTIQIDLIAASPTKYTTYVGHGSDDALDEYHNPGVRTFDGWVDAFTIGTDINGSSGQTNNSTVTYDFQKP